MDALIDLKEASRLLGLSIWTVRGYVKAGKLVPIRFGRRVLVEQAELKTFIQKAKSFGSDPNTHSQH